MPQGQENAGANNLHSFSRDKGRRDEDDTPPAPVLAPEPVMAVQTPAVPETSTLVAESEATEEQTTPASRGQDEVEATLSMEALTLETSTEAVTLDALPDDALMHVIAVCGNELEGTPPLFKAVEGLTCSNALLQQLHRLRPLLGVQSLAVMQRPAHGPWRVLLEYEGELTMAVVEQARLGRVRSIKVKSHSAMTPFVLRRAVPDLLGAGCSLLGLDLGGLPLNGTWASIFGVRWQCAARCCATFV